MTTESKSIDDLLSQLGQAYRAAHPPLSDEEAAEHARSYQERLARRAGAYLDARNESACHLCNARRPRGKGEGRSHDCTTCPNVRAFWHYRRDLTRPVRDRRIFKVRRFFRLWYRIRPVRCRCL